MRFVSFFNIFCILFLSIVINITIGYFQSVDVRGWWPIIVFLWTLIYSIYIIIFLAIDTIQPTSKKYHIIFHFILSTIMIAHTILYFTLKIDWIAINTHTKQLTLLQTIIFSNMTPYAILTSFLLFHSIYTLSNRKKISLPL